MNQVGITNPWLSNNTINYTVYCNMTQPQNPYCGGFGAGEIIEAVYLILVTLVGTFGNLLVIFSIIYDKRVYSQGNLFIINLAVADLMVTGFFLPTVIANVIETENALPTALCHAAGYLVTVTCAVSVCNLMFISINRYWVVVHSKSFEKVFSKRNMYLMILFTWFWPNLIVSPTLFGWSGLMYDDKMEQCGWDDEKSLVYNVLLMVCAIFIPVTVIVYCYLTIYKFVKNQGNYFKRQSRSEHVSISRRSTRNTSHRSHVRQQMQREISLLKTLAVTIIIFLISWIPYGTIVIFFVKTVPPVAKKVAARLGLSNSAMNFIVYGVMHPTYRKGYKNLLVFLMCRGKKSHRRSFRETNIIARPTRTCKSYSAKTKMNEESTRQPFTSTMR